MTSHWQARRRYLVAMPQDEPHFFRYVTQTDFGADEFKSDRDSGRTRPGSEDYCAYLGLSVWETLIDAAERAEAINRGRQSRHLLPYTHIAEISMSKDHGHACAQTGKSQGHHTVWGEPFSLRSSLAAIYTIEGQEVW